MMFIYNIKIGCSKLPSNGFKDFRVKVLKSAAEPDSLPIAHTCFNQLCLYDYVTVEKMKEKLIQAITYTSGYQLK